jgi:hypothetical protein
MAAPEYVPRPPDEVARVYGSPPWRPDSWLADRPGDLAARQPVGYRLGSPGPDQGFVYKLVRHFDERLVLTEGEQKHDAIAGCVGVALKRASLFGRAPVIYDLEIAFTVWGFLREAPVEQVAFRRPLFAEVANPHHYEEARAVADLVPAEVLRLTPEQVAEQATRDWRSVLASPPEVADVVVLPVAAAAEPEPEPDPVVEPASVVEPEPDPVVEPAAVVEPEPEPTPAPESPPLAARPEPLPTWKPPPAPSMRPAAKPAPSPAVAPTGAPKQVVTKKVIKKVIKKKVVKKKPAAADSSIFGRSDEMTSDEQAADEPTRRRDLGRDK